MIASSEKNLFDIECDLYVITVNCKGVMGAGIALDFASRYPNLYKKYQIACENSMVSVGHTYLYQESGKKFLLFPTKDDYREPSRIEWIESGLEYFSKHYEEYRIKSVAFPPLGCTNGKLLYADVENLFKKYLSSLNLDVFVCFNMELPSPSDKRIENYNKLTIDILQNNKIERKTIEKILRYKHNLFAWSDIIEKRIVKTPEEFTILNELCECIPVENTTNAKKAIVIIGESPYPNISDRIVSTGYISKYGFHEVAFLSSNNKICQLLIFSILCGSMDRAATLLERYISKKLVYTIEQQLDQKNIYMINRIGNLAKVKTILSDIEKNEFDIRVLIVGSKSKKALIKYLNAANIQYEEILHPSPRNFVTNEKQIISDYFTSKSDYDEYIAF